MKRYLKQEEPKKNFKVFAYWSPVINDEQYQWVKECGYTHLYIDAKYGATLGSQALKKAVELCGKYGLKGIVNITPFSADTNDYTGMAGFGGANADEPMTIPQLEYLSNELVKFQEKYPDAYFYVNCPNGLLGETGELYLDAYEELLIKNMSHRCLSGDDYPLFNDPHRSRLQEYYAYLKNLADMAERTESEFYFFLQTMSITGYCGFGARRPNLLDLRFLHHILTAFGVAGFQHFCYQTVPCEPYSMTGEFREQDWAAIDCRGYKTPTYEMIKQVIKEMQSIADVYFDFKWRNMIVSTGETSPQKDVFKLIENTITEFGRLCSVSSDKNALIGCFSHKNKALSALYIVNAEEPSFWRMCNVILTFDRDLECVVIQNGKRELIKTENKKLNLFVQSDEGVFVIFEGNGIEKNNTKKRLIRPKRLILTVDGTLTFKSIHGKTMLVVNGEEKGVVLSGENILDKLDDGKNRISLYSKSGKLRSENSLEISFFKETKDNVSFLETFQGENVDSIQVHREWGSLNSVMTVESEGYPIGGEGKVIKLSTKTIEGHDWSALQFLTEPIRYREGSVLYVDLCVTSSTHSVCISQDPMIPNAPAVGVNTLNKNGKWIRIEAPLDILNPDKNETINKLYITTCGDQPYGTLVYVNKYFIDKKIDEEKQI